MTDDAVDIRELLDGVKARAADAEAERRALPCFPALDAGDEERAVDVCEAVGAFEACRWAGSLDACPRRRAIHLYENAVQYLANAPIEFRVPRREAVLIQAAARRRDRVPLLPLDSLRLLRAVLKRRGERVALENGAEVRNGGERIPGAVQLTGTEAIVVLAGNQGRGKTLAACYAIARNGGIYTRAPQWTRREGVDVAEAIRASVLVIDQFGREHFGDSDWFRSQFEDVIDARYQAQRLTFLVGNLRWEVFRQRLDGMTVLDRVHGEGVFVELGGESIRSELRAAALEQR